MGNRGPVAGSAHGLKPGRKPKTSTPTVALVALPDALPAPAPPAGLSDVSTALWRTIWTTLPDGLLAEVDAASIERLCRLLDERARWAHELERHGYMLTEPLQNARGDVIGERVVTNPAAKELRAADKQIDQLSDRLAATPAARARLGVSVSTAQRNAAHASAIVAAKFKENNT